MQPTTKQIEAALREMRGLLAKAHQLEVAGDVEYADACGAVAANKLARANRWADQAASVVPMRAQS